MLIAADLPDDMSIDVITEADLPRDWRTRYEDDELQQVGADWLDRAQSVGLMVPSAVALPRPTLSSTRSILNSQPSPSMILSHIYSTTVAGLTYPFLIPHQDGELGKAAHSRHA